MTNEIEALAYIKGLAQFSLLKREEVDAFVQSRLRQTLRDAVENCDFYKGKQNPFLFLTKEEVRGNIDAGLISNKHLGHPCLVLDRTSGSAGDTVPFAYLQGFQRYARMVFPFMLNTPWRWGDRYCIFSTVHCSRDRCSTNDLPSYVNQIKIPTSDNIFMDKDILDQASAILRGNQETIIHADPFYLCAVVSCLDAQGVRLSFKGISSTYELLTPYVKRYLERIFQCRVFDSYGCSEFGPVAFGCERDGKHIFEGSVFVEIVDKGRYFDSDVGEIVVTSLENPAMPFIRYRTGDLGKLITGPCGCGRTAKMIEIYGRDSQCISFKSVLYSERDIARLMDIPGVLLYQLTQSGADLAFNILLEKGYADHGKQNKIERAIKNKFGGLGVGHISVVFVSHLRPENSGKFKTVISGGVGR